LIKRAGYKRFETELVVIFNPIGITPTA